MERKKAVFLDRDGVVNAPVGLDEAGQPESPLRLADLKIYSYVGECVKRLNRLDYSVFIITNQPAVAKGKMTITDLADINSAIYHNIFLAGGEVVKIYSCIHHPDPSKVVIKELLKDCECRKPKPGLIFQAAREHNIDLDQSWMVGDRWKDVFAGKAAGCRTILVRPIGEEDLLSKPNFVARNLIEAVSIIKDEGEAQLAPPYDLSTNYLHCL